MCCISFCCAIVRIAALHIVNEALLHTGRVHRAAAWLALPYPHPTQPRAATRFLARTDCGPSFRSLKSCVSLPLPNPKDEARMGRDEWLILTSYGALSFKSRDSRAQVSVMMEF
ncbi:hypothetical protein E2C01_020807 [Portunus trituberculatus]|uniref:Secreted protein n=1 Tax=Portunus trituberculatus TaxID=210409 RepID=A0A5B7E333_PORTR|nr:hypothetical protein [Portunus trituberculatus]